MKISRLLIPIMCVLSMAVTAQAKEYLNNGRMYDINDFENYNTGIAAYGGKDSKNVVCEEFGSITNSWALETCNGKMVSAVDETAGKDGQMTKALHFYADGTSTSRDYHLIFQPTDSVEPWNNKTKGKYYVYKFDFKSGGDGAGYFEGSSLNLDERYTIDWSTGKVTINGGGVTLISGENGGQAFALDEWVVFIMIIDRTGDRDIHYLRFESSLGTKEYKIQTNFNSDNYEIKSSNPRFLIGNGWIRGGSVKPDNPSLYIDNIEMYVTDYNVSLRNGGQKGVGVTDKILLDIDGDVDGGSLNTITVSHDGETDSIKSIDYSDGVCTLTLDEKMKEFTEYTVDFSNVKSEIGLQKNFKVSSFMTTGKVELDGSIKLDKIVFNTPKTIDKLEKGLIQTEFTIENKTSADVEDGVIVAKAVNGDKTEAISYRKFVLPAGGKTRLVCAFTAEENYKIELCAKNALNGALYYTDVYTVDKNGISNAAAKETEYPILNAADVSQNSVKFYNLTLGENPARTEVTELTSGLTECAANVSASGNAMLIGALKKNGALKSCVYTVRENDNDNIYMAVNVPDEGGYTLDTFVWDSVGGAAGYMGKTTISSAAEEN